MRVLLVSTYDLGRQPFGLASPAAWLRLAGADVQCIDASRDRLEDADILGADLVSFYLPMHTATRLAAPLIDRTRAINPDAEIAAYGLYAPLNAAWLRAHGVHHVLGPEAEGELLDIVESQNPNPKPQIPRRLSFIKPDRSTLPPLSRYAALQMPDGSRKVVGTTDATRGCKHLCRHCPIVPVYHGTFRAIPIETVVQDIAAQVAAGAQHITFGDPDFFNGPTHARRLIARIEADFPELTYDVTIKIEHLLKHADLLPALRATGCLFITSAVESIDDDVLRKLRKGHTRDDFVRAVDECRRAGVPLSPTFVPFTPWTTRDGYVELLDQIEALGLVEAVAPIQLAIRLLVTAESALLQLPDIRERIGTFDAHALVWPWRHDDSGVDALQAEVMAIVAARSRASRPQTFAAIKACASGLQPGDAVNGVVPPFDPLPYLTEGWYCCAEPGPGQVETV